MDNPDQDDEKIVVTLRHSRKSFLVEYTCSLFLLIMIIFSLFEGGNLAKVAFPFLVLSVFGFASTEVRRFYGDRYNIMQTKLSVIKGIFRIRKRNIYYQPLGFIPDFNIKQTLPQRMLDYGTVFVHVGNTVLELKDVDNPHEVLKMFERLIEETRKMQRNRMYELK
ncbi:MAG: PH domain-containing protein [Nanoarchaeota archaeon]|nr:PH domain-containing protein [Nanoarchaeota archaeon]